MTGWFGTRQDAANKNKGSITPKVAGILTNFFEMSGSYEVSNIVEDEYEVRNKNGRSFHVNLANKTCSCFEFQMLSILCSHSIAVAIKGKVSVEAFGVSS